MAPRIQPIDEAILLTEPPTELDHQASKRAEVEQSRAEQYQPSFGDKFWSSRMGDVAVAADEFASGLLSFVGVGIQTGTAVTGGGCTPVEEECVGYNCDPDDGLPADTQPPTLDIQFVGDGYTHQNNDGEISYIKSFDQYCDGEMQFDLVVADNSDFVIPKAYVGYFSNESGWWQESGQWNLDGIDMDDRLDVGLSVGEAVSISDNISATEDPSVFEFTYTPGADDLADSFPWQFDLYFVATDGENMSEPEMWQYRIFDYSAERYCD